MKEKEIKKEVKLLAKQKKFEQIYQQYGSKYFRKYVSHKYKKEDIRKLIKEGKYLDIYEKYGEKKLEYLYIYYKDIENEVGTKRSLPMKTLYKGKGLLKKFTIYYLATLVSMAEPKEIMTIVNSQKYAKEIEEYTNKVKEYSKKFNIHTQSDMEIIMRVMKDMHETIRGYGEPEIDALGFWGMDVMDENGIGVCRNMAGNIADKLNEINPKYNARTITLYAKAGQVKQAEIENNIIKGNKRINIKGNIIQTYIDEQLVERIMNQGDTIITSEYIKGSMLFMETIERKIPNEIEKIFYDDKGKITSKIIANQESEKTTWYGDNGKVVTTSIIKDGYETTIKYNELGIETDRKREKTDRTNTFLELKKSKGNQEENSIIGKIFGNHAIVAVDIKKDNVTLLIDPTNLTLGVFIDGDIIMFNETQLSEAIYDKKIIGTVGDNGIRGILEYPIDYIKSFIEPTLNMKELEEKYGLEAQNKMLKKIEREDKEKRTDAKTFRQNYKVDKGVTYNFDTNTVTIEPSEIKMEEENQKGH